MTLDEFAPIMAYLAAAVGKQPSREQVEVYFDLLGDLPADVLLIAAKRAVLESGYPTLPPAGTLRRLATQSVAGELPSAMEAWGLVRRAVSTFGYFRRESGLASLPEVVARAAECLGWREICDSENPDAIRARFCQAYDAVAGRVERERLLPPALRQALAGIAKALPAPAEDTRSGREIFQDAGLLPSNRIRGIAAGIGRPVSNP